ncbi:MAG: acetyl-CoA carboxylase, biotin carboxyl carrier protein, partial [Candidatus Rokubacteria bacterium RIFCSPHIGHO2_02_FULL_69_13]
PAAPVVSDVEAVSGVTIEAPMVGTFYRAPSPNAEPYVHEGDVVKEGQILCIIEAMKLMNEIESKVAGRVVRILVENGHGVEYGQPLFLIEPSR